VKNEVCEEENAVIEGEEIVLETVDTSGHVLPVIVEEAETAVVEEIIQVRRKLYFKFVPCCHLAFCTVRIILHHC
jgi:hypothetical protein